MAGGDVANGREHGAGEGADCANERAGVLQAAPSETEQALESVLSSPDAQAVADASEDVARNLPAYLAGMLDAKGLTQSQAIKDSGMNYNHGYDVFTGRRGKGLTREKALGLCFGLRCDLREAQQLLWQAKCSRLYARNRRDALIIYCLERGLTLLQADQVLYENGEETICKAQ